MDKVVRRPIVESASLRTDETSRRVTDDEVARSAFALYCERGGHDGHDVDDWLQAERGTPRGREVYVTHTLVDQQVLERIRGEYLEMPGLSLKADQVQRLCGVEREPCKHVLDTLVKRNFLRLKSNGAYARVIDRLGEC